MIARASKIRPISHHTQAGVELPVSDDAAALGGADVDGATDGAADVGVPAAGAVRIEVWVVVSVWVAVSVAVSVPVAVRVRIAV